MSRERLLGSDGDAARGGEEYAAAAVPSARSSTHHVVVTQSEFSAEAIAAASATSASPSASAAASATAAASSDPYEAQSRFFAPLLEIEENRRCFECGTTRPSWASVSFGVFLCLKCAGMHRGLGVSTSFVRSITLDKWNEKQLWSMKLGGNARASRHFSEHPLPSSGFDKYNSKPAFEYRTMLKKEVHAHLGIPLEEPPPESPKPAPIHRYQKSISSDDYPKEKKWSCWCNLL
ncbi:Arf GTPase activating protein [Pelomyxa schiedti]|nr:Arf GTPase activating protein [Pelomyxa schiedti]